MKRPRKRKQPSHDQVNGWIRNLLETPYDSLGQRSLCKLLHSHVYRAELHCQAIKRNERRAATPNSETSRQLRNVNEEQRQALPSPDSSSAVTELVDASALVEIFPDGILGTLLLDLVQIHHDLKLFFQEYKYTPQQWPDEDLRVELCLRFEAKEVSSSERGKQSKPSQQDLFQIRLVDLFHVFLAERSLAIQYENSGYTTPTNFTRYTRSFHNKETATRSTKYGLKQRELELRFRDGEPGVSALVNFKRWTFEKLPQTDIPLFAEWLHNPHFQSVLDLGKSWSPLVNECQELFDRTLPNAQSHDREAVAAILSLHKQPASKCPF
jgi:hypothetical protein